MTPIKNNFEKLAVFTLAFFLAFNVSYAKKSGKTQPTTNRQNRSQNDNSNMKGLLIRIIKQKEHLDDSIEEMEDHGNDLSLAQILSLDLTFNLVNKNIKRATFLAKEELIKIRPEANAFKYAKAILSHADKLNKKAFHIQRLIGKSLAKNSKRPGLRDALNSKKSKKVKGKSFREMIKEKKAIKNLAKSAKRLRASSKKLNATSKWLYVVSK